MLLLDVLITLSLFYRCMTNYVCAFDDIPVSHGVLAFRRGLISKNKIFTVWIMKGYLFSESLQEWVT